VSWFWSELSQRSCLDHQGDIAAGGRRRDRQGIKCQAVDFVEDRRRTGQLLDQAQLSRSPDDWRPGTGWTGVRTRFEFGVGQARSASSEGRDSPARFRTLLRYENVNTKPRPRHTTARRSYLLQHLHVRQRRVAMPHIFPNPRLRRRPVRQVSGPLRRRRQALKQLSRPPRRASTKSSASLVAGSIAQAVPPRLSALPA